MSEQTHRELAQMSVTQLQRLNQQCNDFERQWRSGSRPTIETALQQCADEDREALLRLLIPLDIAYRREAEESLKPDDYLRRFDSLEAEWLDRVLSDQTIHTRDTPTHGAAAASALLPAGMRIGSYEILEQIGTGGMADVYRARHLLLLRDVALKLLRDPGDHGSNRHSRFQKEMVIIARLSHPHIVTAFDAGVHDDRTFLVTELIDGTDLSRMVKANGPFTIRKAIDCLRQAGQGLQYAHEQGVIHRDVKPSNLLIDGNGVVKVSDLGLAGFSQLQNEHSLAGDRTATDLVMGTVDYMAPEQARSAKLADARSDLYSLGCTLFYLLTGRPLFLGETLINRLEAHRNEPPPRLGDIRPDIPPGLETIFQKMVAKQPEMRFLSMSQLLNALDEFESGNAAPDEVDWSFTLGSASPTFGGQKNSPTLPTTAIATPDAMPRKSGSKSSRRQWLIATGTAAGVLAAVGITAAIIASMNGDDVPEDKRPEKPDELVVPFAHASQRQQEWAKYFGVDVKLPVNIGGGEKIDFVFVPPGRFRMGSTPEQITAMDNMQFDLFDVNLETASPEMTRIEQPFYISTTEITVGMFRQFVESSQPRYRTTPERNNPVDGEGPGGYGLVEDTVNGKKRQHWERSPQFRWDKLGVHPLRDDNPVVGVSWIDAQAFCRWLTNRSQANGENVIYRLPTEAEWEFAARAGTDTIWFFGNDPAQLTGYAVHNKLDRTVQFTRVASKLPNQFGLYDVYGGEAEWCLGLGYPNNDGTVSRVEHPDINRPASDRYRPQRGGGLMTPQSDCRSASVHFRRETTPEHGGFRIVREIPKK